MKRALLATALAAAACGNYTNDDVDFQYAVPERQDLSVSVPALTAADAADAAEYYLFTRGVVRVFDVLATGLTGIVDAVRAYAPSARTEDTRVWGPFPNNQNPSWENQLIIRRVPDASGETFGFAFHYDVQYRRRGVRDAAWASLMTGDFKPSGGARRGSGNLMLTLAGARAAGYPVGDFGDLETLTITYHRSTYPITVKATIMNAPTALKPGGTYDYLENADGSGSMSFVWREAPNPVVSALEVRSRWLATGEGRADARPIDGLAALVGVKGIDCWGRDGRATYLLRGWEPKRVLGDPATCVFGDLP
jgi:hypothetical protein